MEGGEQQQQQQEQHGGAAAAEERAQARAVERDEMLHFLEEYL